MDIYKNWLRSNGIPFTTLPIGVAFHYQGGSFIIADDTNDPLYLNLLMPKIYELENNQSKVLQALNQINCDLKGVKATLHEQDVWLSIEMFIDKTPEVEDFMDRILGILLNARLRFNFEMSK